MERRKELKGKEKKEYENQAQKLEDRCTSKVAADNRGKRLAGLFAATESGCSKACALLSFAGWGAVSLELTQPYPCVCGGGLGRYVPFMELSGASIQIAIIGQASLHMKLSRP